MNKMRVYELAKEMGYSSKEFLELLRNMGVDARSNFSVLEDPTVKTIREMLRKDGGAVPRPVPEKEAAAAPPPPPPPPVEEEKPPVVVREVRRIPGGPGGGQTMVTTIDPAAAAAMSMARSTGPKPKPGGEVRRIIPAARLEALRSQQNTGRPAEGVSAQAPPAPGTMRPATPPSPQAPVLPRPAGAAPGAPTAPPARTVPTPPAPGMPVAARPGPPPARPMAPAARPVPSAPVAGPRPAAPTPPGTPPPAAPQRPVAGAEGQRPAAPGAAVPPPPRPQPVAGVRPPGAPVAARPAAAPASSAAGPPPVRPVGPPARPMAPPSRPAPSPDRMERPNEAASRETHASVPGMPGASTPAGPARLGAGPSPSAPPPRPMRGSGPAVRPMVPLPPPVARPPMAPASPVGRPPQSGGARRPGPGGRRDDRRDDRREVPLPQMRGRKPDFRAPIAPAPVELKDVELPDHISVVELAGKLEISPTEIIKTLMSQGLLVTINQTITFDKAQQIASSHGYNAILSEEPEEVVQEQEDEENLVSRPPVVTVLGHVDHGKTSLLDAIRSTNVTAGEAGGITQSIGAYTVNQHGRHITFIDTPGHEAFTQMRVRGAQVTDIAILVVAADDGVMPQTVEAINHVKAAAVPIVVAINKVDKPGANPDRVKQQLTEHGLIAEDWGGQTVMVPVSAKQKTGLDELLEMALLSADLLELKANPNQKARGTIIEGKLDKGLGPVATVLVQTGTLRVGDSVVCGETSGKVRALVNDRGERIRKAGPAIPAEIIGLSAVPEAGNILQVVDDEKVARTIVEARTQRAREKGMGPMARTSLDDLYKQLQEGEVKDLNLIIKADGQGSVEALRHALLRLTTQEVRVNVVHGGVGAITESDILLATASSAIIIGFNVRPDPNVKKLAEQEGVDIRNYRVIYHVTEDIQAAMKGMLAPEFEEVSLGRVEVRQVFKVSKIGTVAGCYVTEGKVTRNADIRVLRDSVVVYEGKIESLRRFKDDVREVQGGYECGLTVEKFPGIQPGDILEVYKMEEKPRE